MTYAIVCPVLLPTHRYLNLNSIQSYEGKCIDRHVYSRLRYKKKNNFGKTQKKKKEKKSGVKGLMMSDLGINWA